MRSDLKVLVTGAGGYIGGWVVEAFHLNGMTQVRAGIRRWASAARIARFPVDIVPCDIMDPAQLDGALKDIEVVVHCAYSTREVNVHGTRNLLEACLRNGVRRVVHLSTMDVYGRTEGVIDESTPLQYTGREYGDSKIDAEKVCNEFIRRGFQIVILRPTVVYGPYCKSWIAKFGERLQSGRWGLFERAGDGICNPVYVMDLVRAIGLAIDIVDAAGQAFNINGGETVSWNEYFIRLNACLGLPPLRVITPAGSRRNARLSDSLHNVARFVLSHFKSQLAWAHQNSTFARRLLRYGGQILKNTPSSEELSRFGETARVPIGHAQSVLGYRPLVSLDAGIKMSVLWLRHERPIFPRACR